MPNRCDTTACGSEFHPKQEAYSPHDQRVVSGVFYHCYFVFFISVTFCLTLSSSEGGTAG